MPEISLTDLPDKIGLKDYVIGDYCTAHELIEFALKKYTYKYATLHHADFSRHRVLGKAGIDDDDETIINYLYQWHVIERKWKKGIGYPLIIIPDGRLLLTYRGLLGLQGAHVHDHNKNNLGLLDWGDFNEEEPSDCQIAMTRIVRSCLRDMSDITDFRGHGEWSGWTRTSCPGSKFPLGIWH